jgi:diguanylate cyclase (GGDEF)-like protein
MNLINSLIFFGAPSYKIESEALQNRINVERTKIYFQHTKMSFISLILGLSIGVILLTFFEVSWIFVLLWAITLLVFGLILFLYENSVKKQIFTSKNVVSYIGKRLAITFCIALIWGFFIQLMPDSSKLGYTLSYIAMSTFIHIGFLSYSIVPIQFLINFLGVLLPFELKLLNQYAKTNNSFFAILATIFVLCEGILFIKALVNAKTAIQAIILQEKLKDEISASSKAKKQIEYLAYHDQLTKVWNRHYIQMRLESLFCKKKTFGIILLDINYFKKINDTYGHAFGDKFLIQFVQTIQPALPKNALLGRFGGDEFIVLFTECTDALLDHTKTTLKETLQKMYTIDEISMNGSTSIGTALYPKDGNDIEALIHFADKSMYDDKKIDHLQEN